MLFATSSCLVRLYFRCIESFLTVQQSADSCHLSCLDLYSIMRTQVENASLELASAHNIMLIRILAMGARGDALLKSQSPAIPLKLVA